MYSMYAEKKGYKVEIVNANETELGGYKEISFMIEGEGAYHALNMKAVYTVFSVCPKPKARAECILLPQPLPFFPRRKMWSLKLTLKI